MKKYNCIILTQTEVKKLCGKEIEFVDGFPVTYHCDLPDYWNILEGYIKLPVVSIQPGARDDEVFVLCAQGRVENGKAILEGDYDYITSCLLDIFREADNDECEVFDCYEFDTDEETKKNIIHWMTAEFDYVPE